ncbi:MAG TPA: acetyl-CoA C-acyltransferase [Pseudomonadales bacterium]|nr:acetyl-CoA C-acyltransferase [Pseudomonadales bacterium]
MAYIVDAVRTPGGRRDGRLSKVHPADLGGLVINALLDRTKVDPAAIDDVIFGCVSQVGPQTFNLARTAILASKLPVTVPGVTVDRQCGSGQQAIHFAAQAIMSGTQDLVIAGGAENMSMVPIGSPAAVGAQAGMASPFDSVGLLTQHPEARTTQFEGAEKVAKKYGVTREELDHFGYMSHMKGVAAYENGYFENELVPVEVVINGETVLHTRDEGLRANASLEAMSTLKTLTEGGLMTAATSSQICDGAAAVMLASEKAVKQYGLKPLAIVRNMAVVGSDPGMVLEGPIPATQKILKESGLSIEDISIYEVNEAFGSVPLAWAKAIGADVNKLNVNGGAQALGHPLGATGAKLMATLVYELRRRGGKYGLLAICEGLGTANATIIENVDA